jgi:hypothetical protein
VLYCYGPFNLIFFLLLLSLYYPVCLSVFGRDRNRKGPSTVRITIARFVSSFASLSLFSFFFFLFYCCFCVPLEEIVRQQRGFIASLSCVLYIYTQPLFFSIYSPLPVVVGCVLSGPILSDPIKRVMRYYRHTHTPLYVSYYPTVYIYRLGSDRLNLPHSFQLINIVIYFYGIFF